MKQSLFLIALVTSIAGCTPKQEPYLTISAELKIHYNYKPGTYWIYRDSISGDFDSIYVVSNTYTQSLERYTYRQEDISIGMGEQNSSFTSVWTMELYSNYIDLLCVDAPANVYERYIRYSAFAQLPFQVTPLPVNGPDSGAIIKLFLTYGLANGNIFQQAAQITHTGSGNYFSKDTTSKPQNFIYSNTFFMCDSVGIFKMRLNEDTLHRVWELERWHIVK